MLQNEQGAVAVIAPTTIVDSIPNAAFNTALANFTHTNSGPVTFGKLMQQAKNELLHLQGRRYALLGDPAMHLTLPDHTSVIDSIIGIAFQVFADTLAPGQGVAIKGSVIDQDGDVVSGFNGTIELTLYDRAYDVTTQGNQNDPFVLMKRDNEITTLEAAVEAGTFSLQFVLPADLAREEGLLKLSWYAMAGDMDAAGANFLVAGGGPFGIGDNLIAEGLVRIYPTVTSDIVYIEFTKQRHGFTQLSIVDLTGNEVISQNIAGKSQVQLNLAKLPAGVYIAFIKGEAGSVRQKLIVQ
jgi:hypothetical protein